MRAPVPLWLVPIKPNPDALIRLVCLPYAGGHAAVFSDWPQALPTFIEVLAAELPGHGSRIAEPPLTTIAAVTGALVTAVLPRLDKPCVLFGHSMGALLGFELARELRRLQAPRPSSLIVSACRAPQLPPSRRPIHALHEHEFLDELIRLKGTPPAALLDRELMTVLLPGLRADFEACETYRHVAEAPLRCPIHAIGGTYDDEVALPDLDAWRHHTDSLFTVDTIPGDHFFLHTARAPLLQKLARQLRQIANAVA